MVEAKEHRILIVDDEENVLKAGFILAGDLRTKSGLLSLPQGMRLYEDNQSSQCQCNKGMSPFS